MWSVCPVYGVFREITPVWESVECLVLHEFDCMKCFVILLCIVQYSANMHYSMCAQFTCNV